MQNPILLLAYVRPEHNWDGISFDAGKIIVITDTAGIRPMFGQKAFLHFVFNHPELVN